MNIDIIKSIKMKEIFRFVLFFLVVVYKDFLSLFKFFFKFCNFNFMNCKGCCYYVLYKEFFDVFKNV